MLASIALCKNAVVLFGSIFIWYVFGQSLAIFLYGTYYAHPSSTTWLEPGDHNGRAVRAAAHRAVLVTISLLDHNAVREVARAQSLARRSSEFHLQLAAGSRSACSSSWCRDQQCISDPKAVWSASAMPLCMLPRRIVGTWPQGVSARTVVERILHAAAWWRMMAAIIKFKYKVWSDFVFMWHALKSRERGWGSRGVWHLRTVFIKIGFVNQKLMSGNNT